VPLRRATVGNTGAVDELRSAQRAVGREAYQEALVHLWNAVEPARLAGDARQLNAIGGLAQVIRTRGDEGEAREADRLLETLRGAVAAEGGVAPATARLDAEVYASGEPLEGDIATGGQGGAEEEGTGRGVRIGNLVWIVLVIAIILFNVLADRG
jgi:hypothetical protein